MDCCCCICTWSEEIDLAWRGSMFHSASAVSTTQTCTSLHSQPDFNMHHCQTQDTCTSLHSLCFQRIIVASAKQAARQEPAHHCIAALASGCTTSAASQHYQSKQQGIGHHSSTNCAVTACHCHHSIMFVQPVMQCVMLPKTMSTCICNCTSSYNPHPSLCCV